MKTSTVAEALARTLLAAQSMLDAITPRSADGATPPIADALATSLDSALAMAHALAEDARERESAAEATRQAPPTGEQGAAWGPTFGGSAPIPIPTGRGIVPIDAPADAAIDAAPIEAHGAPVTR